MSLKQSLIDVFKRDDDARLLENAQGDIFIETKETIPGHSATESPASPGTVESAANAPLPDIRVLNIAYMFMGNALVTFIWTIGSLFPYIWGDSVPRVVGIVLVSVAATMFCVSYMLMIVTRKIFAEVALGALCVWALFGALTLGASAALAHNVAPVQLSLLFLLQSLCVIAYTKLSPRNIQAAHAAGYMAVVTLIAWSIFIFSFVQEHGWPGGLAILALSIMSIGHSAYEIRVIEGRYSVHWADIQLSVIQFYGDPLLELLKLCQK